MTTAVQTWEDALSDEKAKPYFKDIIDYLQTNAAAGKVIYPAKADIFNAFKYTPYESVKVVIIGQDPYHGPDQAHGLCFSVKDGIKPPPSLINIHKELHADLGIPIPQHGNLERWAHEGVLLLNTSLTVEAQRPQSHAKIGWQTFTDHVIKSLNDHPQGIVYMLWGAYAQSKHDLIDTDKHVILATTHPSPLSAHRGFLGCRHFSKANEALKKLNRTPVNWSLG